MNEEEAIEKLYSGKKLDLITVLRTFKREGIENFVITRKEIIDTVIQALEQKDEEIQELKEDNQHQWDERCKLTFKIEKKDKEIQELKESNVLIKRYFQKCDLIKEKDKIIKTMAKYINSTDKVKDVCEKTGDTYNCTEYQNCEECIIEFFKKKVSEENE